MNKSPVITVSQLNFYVRSLIEGDANLALVYISGEISNFTNHYRSGHFYFTLKDESSAVKAVMFRSSAQRLAFMPENGMKVVIKGRIGVYDRDGVYQLYADDMQPDGLGALTAAYEQLKAKLEKEGLFSSARKRPIPACPMRVGVITSPTGAAVRDILNVLSRRFPLAKIVFLPVQVQGVSASPQITAAIERMNSFDAADVIIVGRGGGSIEDLWAFNDEKLARAVSASRIPIISAVGHETDYTICDFVADLRAPTPSAAAELAVPEKNEQYAYAEGLLLHARSLLAEKLSLRRRELTGLTENRVLKSPLAGLEIFGESLDRLSLRLTAAAKELFGSHKLKLASAAAKLNSLSPLAVLSRGYGMALTSEGKVCTASDVSIGDRLTLRLSDGEIECSAEKITLYEEKTKG